MPSTPEQLARQKIDAALADAGWTVQNRDEMNLAAGPGVAVREFRMAPGHGFADYMLFVVGKAAGVLEAKPIGHTLSGVEPQIEKYAKGLPAGLDPPVTPLPFRYLSTGVETRFINLLDPAPKTRRISGVPNVHRPETLADWLVAGHDPIQWTVSLSRLFLGVCSFLIEKDNGCGACGKPRPWRFSIGSTPSSFARRSNAAGLIWPSVECRRRWL